jgi:hypothetical protein
MYDVFQNKNQWTLTSKQRYTDYSSQKAVFENFLSSLNQNKYSGSLQEQYKSALADLNNKLANFNSQVIGLRNDDLSISQAQVWGNRNDQNNGKITIDTLGQLTNADLVFKVRADWLGIVINFGKPSIVSKTCQTFKAGDSSKITLQVKNIGSGDGNFVPSVICNNIKQTYNINAVPISAGQTSSIQVPIDSGNFAPSSTTSDTCQIRVEEYNKPSNYATSSVTCSIEAPALCVEGSVDISGNCIRKCIEGKPVQLKCCGDGETLLRDNTKLDDEFSGYYCFTSKEENKTIENKQCSWYEKSYEKDVKDWKWYNYLTIGLIPPSTHAERGCRTADWLYLAVGAVVIVVLGIYAINKSMPKKRRKK